MTRLIISILIISLLCFSFRGSDVHLNDNYWECHLNNKLLIKGHVAMPDTVVVISNDLFSHAGIINFHLFFDSSPTYEIETSLFLTSTNNEKVLVSKDTAMYLLGHFKLSRLKEISDSLKSQTLELQCLFDGINKPWRMFKFKLED